MERPITALVVPSSYPSSPSTTLETVQQIAPLQTEDVLLVHRIATQDRQAFDTFYTQYAPRLRRYVARLLSDQALVDEVGNDVMLVVWQQAARFPATVPLWAWLCGTARHKAHTARARTAARALAPAGPADSQAATPEVLLLRQEAECLCNQALDTLPFYERTALRLLVQQGYSYPDIAAVMDTPLSTVRTRLWRACHRLRAYVVAVDATLPRPRPSPRVRQEGQTARPPATDPGAVRLLALQQR